MKLTYIANARLPTEKAHGIQIMKMCEAFAENGADVTLVVPWRVQPKQFKGKDPFTYYKVKRNFTIKKLPSIDFGNVGSMPAFLLQNWSFVCSAIFYALLTKSDIIFTRDEWTASLLTRFKKVVYEAHVFPKKAHSWYKRWMPRLHSIVTINNGLKKLYSAFSPKENICVAHDGVDLAPFKKLPSQAACRKKLNIPAGEQVAMYTGHLYSWKGVDTIFDAAKQVKGSIYMVGGTTKDIEKYKAFIKEKNITNVHLVGHVSPHLVPFYLRAADVVLLTSSGKHKISKYYTSPLKLFEYMASKTPILASDVPSSKEIIRHKKNGVLYQADDAEDFAEKLNWMFSNKMNTFSQQAYKDVQKHTWKQRAKEILTFIK